MGSPGTEPSDADGGERLRRRDIWVAASAGLIAAGMVGMAYAAVPLYDWFCRTTGFGGTTQVAVAAPSGISDETIVVRFDANVDPGLPWSFRPDVTSKTVRLGEVVTMEYTVVNRAARPTLGMASYNVAPLNTGSYFHKINCFCFTEQPMAASETRKMTVVFYVDPKLAETGAARPNTITLSYSFHRQQQALQPQATNWTTNRSATSQAPGRAGGGPG